jgi:hypothetical protein
MNPIEGNGMDELDGMTELEHRLEAERPVPSAAFRGELRRHLVQRARQSRPARLRLLIAAYGGAGATLLLVAAVGVTGIGPLAA